MDDLDSIIEQASCQLEALSLNLRETSKANIEALDILNGIPPDETGKNRSPKEDHKKENVAAPRTSSDLAFRLSCIRHSFGHRILDMAQTVQRAANILLEETEESLLKELGTLVDQANSDNTNDYERKWALQLQAIFTQFTKPTQRIVQDALRRPGFPSKTALWSIAEECCLQASQVSGTLYYGGQGGTADEDQKMQQGWSRAWMLVLNRCPGGPTLFCPQLLHGSGDTGDAEADAEAETEANIGVTLDTNIPRYLFRVADSKSSGRTDDRVVASAAAEHGFEISRLDLLRRNKRVAVGLLHAHLNKKCVPSGEAGEDEDNLVSWTSSLLFAIQYAIFRQHTFCCPAADIVVCAVDTRRFPPGQFVSDKWLLDQYWATAEAMAEENEDAWRFFKFRRNFKVYHNGEYLSQGSLAMTGRCAVVSLAQLQAPGLLPVLYPEFEAPEGHGQWANRAKQLRADWKKGRYKAGVVTLPTTTLREMETALRMARECFATLATADIALLLLAFKSRQLRTSLTVEPPKQAAGEVADYNPIEVKRYEAWAALLEEYRCDRREAYTDFQLLENVLVLS